MKRDKWNRILWPVQILICLILERTNRGKPLSSYKNYFLKGNPYLSRVYTSGDWSSLKAYNVVYAFWIIERCWSWVRHNVFFIEIPASHCKTSRVWRILVSECAAATILSECYRPSEISNIIDFILYLNFPERNFRKIT